MQKEVAAARAIATSLMLSLSSVVLFALFWSINCPAWLDTIGVRCDLVVALGYLVLCPALSVLALIFAGRDIVYKEWRAQAIAAFCMASALLVWLWRHPPPLICKSTRSAKYEPSPRRGERSLTRPITEHPTSVLAPRPGHGTTPPPRTHCLNRS